MEPEIDWLEKYKELLREYLQELDEAKQDELCDRMDLCWVHLTENEREVARKATYWIREELNLNR